MQHIAKRFRKFAAELAGTMSEDAFDILTQIGISKYYPVGKHGRCWVTGYLQRHAFEALLHPGHSQRPEMELQGSRIRRLCLRQLADDRIVAAFDKGWGIPPSTEAAREIVDELTSVLAFRLYGPLMSTSPTTRRPSRN